MGFGKSGWRTFEQGAEKEWLLTNGIGGFASSTIIGANTRRYHGLLVASLKPPVERHLILSKIDETITVNGRSHNLYAFKTPGFTMEGQTYLQWFELTPLPTFVYRVGDIFIEKKISMVYGENTTVISYRVVNASREAVLTLTPLVNFRDYHHTSRREGMGFGQKAEGKTVYVKAYENNPDITLYCSDGFYRPMEDTYFLDMDYPVERERGLDSTEDHYIPGSFEVALEPGESREITFIASIEARIKEYDGAAVLAAEEERLKSLTDRAGYEDAFAKRLVLAADHFIAYRKSIASKTILAGYPWFTDWGRDAMIAFTGITLVPRRFDDARDILLTYVKYLKDGLIPNMFPDGGGEPAYNSVDAALWYFEAVSKYIRYTGDYGFIKENIYSALKEIIQYYIKGTHFQIRMEEDYLISAGNSGTQLTWMDAKVGEQAVTPRHGKAVEINALWYNGLKILGTLAREFGEDRLPYEGLAENVRQSFEKCFWNDSGQCLYDVVAAGYRDGRVRPNQVLALSLTYPVLEGEKAEKVVEKVWKELYTPYGLRSLSKEDPEYKGIYAGSPWDRDGAYHQGTVWAWLLGQFITAFRRVKGYSSESGKIARMMINSMKDHLEDGCLSNISEIFDGDEPFRPRGCFAQAWSTGEFLRCYMEDTDIFTID